MMWANSWNTGATVKAMEKAIMANCYGILLVVPDSPCNMASLILSSIWLRPMLKKAIVAIAAPNQSFYIMLIL